jgi:hypothetical protein
VRIYHDSSTTSETICKLKCLKDEQTDELLDIVDFCNVAQIELDFTRIANFSYIHGMNWRFLPIGDTFVRNFMSRDVDSWITNREADSVDMWMRSNTLLHVMRGIPVNLDYFIFLVYFLVCKSDFKMIIRGCVSILSIKCQFLFR